MEKELDEKVKKIIIEKAWPLACQAIHEISIEPLYGEAAVTKALKTKEMLTLLF